MQAWPDQEVWGRLLTLLPALPLCRAVLSTRPPFPGLLSPGARASLFPQQPSLCPLSTRLPHRLDPFPPSSTISSPWASSPGSVLSFCFHPTSFFRSQMPIILDQRLQCIPVRSPLLSSLSQNSLALCVLQRPPTTASGDTYT